MEAQEINRRKKISITNILLLYGVYIVYIVLGIGIISFSVKFISPVNLLQLLIQASRVIIVCVGNVFVLVTAGIDMSVGSTAFFSAALASYLLTNTGVNPYLAILLMLVVGTSIGVINGLIVRKFNIYPLITTLGILFAGRGLGQYLIQGGVKVLPKEIIFFGNGKIFGIPVPIIIAVFFLIVGQFVLTKTSFGRQVVAIGDNEQAASKSGIMVGKIKMIVYIVSGFSAAISGLVLSAQVSSVYPNTAKDLEFTVLVSLVVGGVSLFGAKGSVFPGAFIGVIFLTTIFNGLVIANASPYLFPVIKGVVIFLAILVDTIKMRKNVISIYKFSKVKD